MLIQQAVDTHPSTLDIQTPAVTILFLCVFATTLPNLLTEIAQNKKAVFKIFKQ
jgi:hypothetical protein